MNNFFAGENTGIERKDETRWLAARHGSVGASEIGSFIPSGNRYEGPDGAYKRRQAGRTATSTQTMQVQTLQSNNMMAGSLLQPWIEEEALRALGGWYKRVERAEGGEVMWRGKQEPTMSATPDLLCEAQCLDGTPAHLVVECKLTTDFSALYADIEGPKLPSQTWYQIQHQIAVLCDLYGSDTLAADCEGLSGSKSGMVVGWAAVLPLGRLPAGWPREKRVHMFGPYLPHAVSISQMWAAAEAMRECIQDGVAPSERTAGFYEGYKPNTQKEVMG